MPVGQYPDFATCIRENQDKESPEGFCAYLEHETTGKWPGEIDMKSADGIVTTKTLYDVEVFATGTWTDSSGNTQIFTADDLDTMVRNFQEGAPLKAGHSPDEFNAKLAQALDMPVDVVTGSNEGQGAVGLGRMVHLKRAGNRLLAAFQGVPVKIVKLIKDRLYNSVSAELTAVDGGYTIRGVALLGAQQPAVGVLDNRLPAAKVFSYSMSEPSIQDVTPVPGGGNKKHKQEDTNIMALPTDVKPSTEPAPAPPAAPANSGAEALKAIAQALNLDPNQATVEQIVEAIKSLTASTSGVAAATGPMMSLAPEARAMFAATEAKTKTLETEVATLKRDKRVLTFTERAKNWTAIVTDTAAEVQSLVDMPDAVSENIAKAYDRAYEAMKKTQLFERIGPAASAVTTQPTHAWYAKSVKCAADNKVSIGEAMLKCEQDDPKGYQSFMESARADGFQVFQATTAK